MTDYMDKVDGDGYIGDPIDPDFDEFNTMVEKLFKTEGFHDRHAALMHAAVGISGEVGELAEAYLQVGISSKQVRIDLVEELGDIFFYLTAISVCLNTLPQYVDRGSHDMHVSNSTIGGSESLLLRVSISSSNVLDIVKKGWVYGKDIDMALLCSNFGTLVTLVGSFCDSQRISEEECLDANMLKLSGKGGRYEKGYSDKAAQERKDKVKPTIQNTIIDKVESSNEVAGKLI